MASEPSLGSTTTKRKDTENSEQPIPKRPRSRVSFSCAECHRRKQKCDRRLPCSHCTARKIPDLCRPYMPGKSDVDLLVRVTRLEQIIELALPQYSNVERSTEPRDLSSSPEEDPNESSIGREDRDAYRTVVHSPFLEQLQRSSLSSVLEDAPPPAARLQSLVLECDFSPHILSDLVTQLPDRNLSHALVDYYFAAINYTRYPLYEPSFRTSYQSVCSNGNNLQPADIRFLPLLFVVLALSMRLSPDHIGGNERMRRLTSLRLYWSSRRAVLIASAIQTDSLEIVLTRLLGARYNIFDRRITESWGEIGAAIRTAQALGLHRDPSNFELEIFQAEYRRRIWAYVYHADRAYAFITGRPKCISDDYTSTRAPLNVDDALLEKGSPGNMSAQPLSNPTHITFAILRHSLASIIGRISHHFQKLQGHELYSNVLALEDELQNFIASLPPCYALSNPDTSYDKSRPFVPVHRFLLLTEVMFYRIGLHRPYFLRRLDTGDFNLSRQACIESARHDTEIRKNFNRTASREVIDACGGMFRAFQSTMICGIALIIDPNREDAPEMHGILDSFLQTVPEAADLEVDVATQRELKIIEFLRSKIVMDSASTSHIVLGGDPVLPNIDGAPRSLNFPQPSIRLSHTPSNHSNATQPQPSPRRPSFLSTHYSTTNPGPFPPSANTEPSIAAYSSSEVGATQNGIMNFLDNWGYNNSGSPDEQILQANNEQWAGGSDIVPEMMFTMFNKDPNLAGTRGGEWSYWEALVNQIRVGRQS